MRNTMRIALLAMLAALLAGPAWAAPRKTHEPKAKSEASAPAKPLAKKATAPKAGETFGQRMAKARAAKHAQKAAAPAEEMMPGQ